MNAKDKTGEMQGGRGVDEAEEMQGGKDEGGAVVQQRNRAINEADGCREAAVRIRLGYRTGAEIRTRPRRGSAAMGRIRPW